MAAPADPVPGFGNFKQEVYQDADTLQQMGQQGVAEADKQGEQQIDLAERYAASQEPFTEETPKDQIAQVMNGAPWLFALTALGGAASKMNGMAMIEGLNGLSSGLIAGDQQALDQGWKKYNADYEKWKARQDQQARIYDVLSNAYGKAGDAKLRALTAAQKMTNDAMSLKLDVDDPRKVAELRSKIEESHAKVVETYTKIKAMQASGANGQGQALIAALNEKGANLSSGGSRSKDQINKTAEAIMARHPDMSPDQVAEMIMKGQLAFAAEKKETQTAAASAGRVAIATQEINKFAPLVLQASAKVDRGSWVPMNRLLQMADASISDPNLKKLKITINAMLNAYDQLAARGGTDKEKRAQAHALIEAADSPEALQAGIEQFQQEAQVASEAAAAAEKGNGGKAPNKSIAFGDLP
jgi:hypothetical protein